MCLINRAAVKKLILDEFRRTRPDAGITRVSAQALAKLEARLHTQIVRSVQSHPSNGKTFTEVS